MEDEIHLELERGKRSLDAAKLLFEKGLYEDSVSRSYYAMFHAARALLLTKDIRPTSHAGVVSLFGLHFVKDGLIERDYARMISQGLDLREDGDYGVYTDVTKTRASEILSDAEKFFINIKEVLESGKRLPQKN